MKRGEVDVLIHHHHVKERNAADKQLRYHKRVISGVLRYGDGDDDDNNNRCHTFV